MKSSAEACCFVQDSLTKVRNPPSKCGPTPWLEDESSGAGYLTTLARCCRLPLSKNLSRAPTGNSNASSIKRVNWKLSFSTWARYRRYVSLKPGTKSSSGHCNQTRSIRPNMRLREWIWYIPAPVPIISRTLALQPSKCSHTVSQNHIALSDPSSPSSTLLQTGSIRRSEESVPSVLSPWLRVICRIDEDSSQ